MKRAPTKATKRTASVAPDPIAAPATDDLPALLLEYQRDILTAIEVNKVVVVEKSRRIGATWGVAAGAVLMAGAGRTSGGMNVFYIGFNREMTEEFIDTCGTWAKSFGHAAADKQEFLFKETGDDGAERAIQAFRITFASGFEIVALCSRPRSLRGRQGFVIIDEAAFHDELEELLKAALALLIWGGKVLVISTHDGVENPFNLLIDECRAGRRPFKVLRTTFDDALQQGLYRRICLSTGTTWSAEAEVAWAADIRAFYGDGASEELDVIPRASGGKYIARSLLEARSVEVPVLRWALPDTFVDLPEERRVRDCLAWCEENVAPILAQLGAFTGRSFGGNDFGRSGDLSTFWPILLDGITRRCPFVVELRNVPFTTQAQVVHFILDRLPRFGGAAFDARGNGQYLAEVSRQRYGTEAIAEVMLSEGWYRENWPPVKAALEDGTFEVPRDNELLDDFRAIELVKGVPRVVERTKGATGQRHGDGAIAAVLSHFASRTLDAGPISFAASGSRHASLGAFGDSASGPSRSLAAWT